MIRASILSLPAVLATAFAVAGCGGANDGVCTGSSCVFVSTATYNADFTGMGVLDKVDLTTGTPTLNLDATLDPDVTMKIVNGELWVLMRDTGSLRIYDPTTLAVKVELPTGDNNFPSSKSFPQDFWYNSDNGDIFVTLSGNVAANAVGILNRDTPGVLDYMAMPQDPSDTDGKPEAYQIYPCQERLFITLQSYTVNMDDSVTYAPGRIVDVTPNTRAIRDVITLQGRNPNDLTDTGRGDCFDTVVATSGNLTSVPDGTANIERINLGEGVSKGVLITDTQLGGRPTYLAAESSSLLYVAEYYDPEPNGMGQTFLSSVKIVSYDIDTMMLKGDITGPYGNINFMNLHDSKLFYGAGIYAGMEETGKGARGLYHAPDNGQMVTVQPIDLQLTPSAIAFPQ